MQPKVLPPAVVRPINMHGNSSAGCDLPPVSQSDSLCRHPHFSPFAFIDLFLSTLLAWLPKLKAVPGLYLCQSSWGFYLVCVVGQLLNVICVKTLDYPVLVEGLCLT